MSDSICYKYYYYFSEKKSIRKEIIYTIGIIL